MFNAGAGHPLIRHSQLKCKFKGNAQQHRPQTVSLVPPSSAADERSGQKGASNSSTEEYMNQALFLSSDEMHRQLNAAKRLRSDFLHAMALGTRRKFVAPNRIVSSLRAAMSRRTVAGLACALSVGVGAFHSSLGQSTSSGEYWRADVTAVAIAPDGTWGTATEASTNQAIAKATADCKRKYKSEIGCGYRSTFVREGWSLVFRCGTENVIVAEKELADAERAAFRQQAELRQRYVPNMPDCVRTLTIDPHGGTVVPKMDVL